MNRIVREHYPVSALPVDLRGDLPATANVRVTIEAETAQQDVAQIPSLDDLFALRQPSYRPVDDIAADIRRERDAWDD